MASAATRFLISNFTFLIFLMDISSNSVLFGIATPRCVLRTPTGLIEDQVLSLAAPNLATKFRYNIEGPPNAQLNRLSKLGVIRSNPQGFRLHLVFAYQYLTVAQAQEWGKVFNGYMAGYQIILTPHNDDALKLTFEVIPEGDFDLGFLAEKYMGHSGTFLFQSKSLISSVDLHTSLNLTRQVTYAN